MRLMFRNWFLFFPRLFFSFPHDKIIESPISFRIIRHNVEKSTLNITVVRCQGLPARDSNVGSSDPYVKLQLLPDKQHKVKTRVLRRTLSPVYDEDFTFYGIGENQLQVDPFILWRRTFYRTVCPFGMYERKMDLL